MDFRFIKIFVCVGFLCSFPTFVVCAGCNECHNDLTADELLTWTPPLEMQRNFPYFVSGHDKQGHPVWVFEYGKYDMRGLFKSEEALRNFNKTICQAQERFTRPKLVGRFPSDENKMTFIIDAENYQLSQLLHLDTIRLFMNCMTQLRDTVSRNDAEFKRSFVINANTYFRILWFFGRLAAGSEFVDKFSVYGSDRSEWEAAILNHVDRDQIPDWLGGFKTHRPVKVFG